MTLDHRRLLNECPTVVGMLTTSVESGGSLDTAVRTVAEEGPKLSSGIFSEVVRLTDTKGCQGISQGLAAAMGRLPARASGYKHAVLLCIAASESGGSEERLRLLKEASDVALDSVRNMGESYSSSLTVPCMTVFGLGIMVPMILMSIVPMLGIEGMFGTAAIDGDLVILITIVAIPAVILMLTVMIRKGNPFISEPLGWDGVLSASPLLLIVPLFSLQIWMGNSVDQAILLSVAPAGALTAVLLAGHRRSEKRRRESEQGLRDSVFEMGNRMMSGDGFETVCVDALDGRRECTDIRDSLARELGLCRGDVSSALQRSVGQVSGEVCRALCDILRCSERNGEDAGRLAIALGRQFHNSDVVRKDLELKLKSMTDMMTGTAVLFAPMVLGMSMSMLEPLSGLAGYQPIGDTGAVLSLYLVELCALIALLTSNLGGGEDLRSMVWRFSVMAPVALIVFNLCSGLQLRRSRLSPGT